MSKEKNDFFVIILFSIFWILCPISYDEMRNRHPIYPQENVVVLNSNKKYNFSEVEVKALGINNENNETILVKGVDGYTAIPNYAGRRSSPGRTSSSPKPTRLSKPPRFPSGSYRMPNKPVEKQGVFGGATGLGGSSDSGSGSPGDNSNSNNPFNRESSNQCQDPSYYHQPKKKKKKRTLEQ